MEAVAQRNQSQSDDVVQHELLEVLARLLQHEDHDQTLLRPVCSLEQVVCLEVRIVGLMREADVHRIGVEEPHRRAAHDEEPVRAEDAKVDRGVRLLHEARLLAAVADAGVDRNRADHALHQELAGEGQDDGVEAEECQIFQALAILRRTAHVGRQRGGAVIERRVLV